MASHPALSSGDLAGGMQAIAHLLNRLGFTRDLIDEIEADSAARTFVRHERRQRRQSPPRWLGGEHSLLLQAAEDIGQPLLRTPGMPVGTEIIRSLGQAGKQRAFLERELL